MNPKVHGKWFILMICMSCMTIVGCTTNQIRRARCTLRGTGPRDGKINGVITIQQDGDSIGSTIHVEASGLYPNATHGFHFHQYGDISDQISGLNNGAHFAVGEQSDGARHGSPFSIDPRPHNGDLGNVIADAYGKVSVTLQPSPNPWVRLDGSGYSVVGRSAVIHEKMDDASRTSPTGNAGGRYAQCVIGLDDTSNIELSRSNVENVASATPVPSGSFVSCTLSPLKDSIFASKGADPGPNGQMYPMGEIRFETNALGFVDISGSVYMMPPSQALGVYVHKYGSLESSKSIGPIWSQILHEKVEYAHLKNMVTNCRGVSEYKDNVDGLTFPITRLVGRTLAIHQNSSDPESPVLAGCVLGLAAFTKQNPIFRRTVIPKAECVFEATTNAMNLKGRLTINSTDEYDCAVQVTAHQISGFPIQTNDQMETNQKYEPLIFQIYNNGDLLDINAKRLGSVFMDLISTTIVNGTIDGKLTSNPITNIRLTGMDSIIGRGISLHFPSKGMTKGFKSFKTDQQSNQNIFGQCVVGMSDVVTSEEKILNLPNSKISQKNASIQIGVAKMSPTYFYPPAIGQIWFNPFNNQTNDLEVELAILAKPLTNYTIRIYNHGSIRSKIADNFPLESLYLILYPIKSNTHQDDFRFLSDTNGYIRYKIPLVQNPTLTNPQKTLLQIIGKAILVQPVYDEVILPAVGYGVIGIAYPEYVFPPDIIKTPILDQQNDQQDNTTLIAASVGGAVGACLVLGTLMLIKYRKGMKHIDDKAKKLVKNVEYSDLSFGKQLGSGSFGEVYVGSWRGTEVAIKRLNFGKITKEALKEFDHEVTVMIELRHPNLVLYMAACTTPPNLCIVLEFMQRGSLYDALHDEKIEIIPSMQISFLIDAAKGLQYLHLSSPPILHRDLKSPNLLLDGKWNCKISDFGLSGVSKNEKDKAPPGTLFWMAPEVVGGLEYTRKSDVYSYAIIMWEVFTRLEPYYGEMAESVVYRVRQEGLRPVVPAGVSVPTDLVGLMNKSWSQDENIRPEFNEILKQLSLFNDEKSTSTFASMASMNRTKSGQSEVNAPKGNVAFVFTDVQSSTSLWEKYAEDMAEALSLHNEIMRGVISKNQGYEVKTEGDAFMVTFKNVRNATLFALQAQEFLVSANWSENIVEHPSACKLVSKGIQIFNGLRVRMGIHWGEPICKEDPITGRMDYFGPVVNKAARVGGFPKGGQVVLSDSAYEEIKNDLEGIGSPFIRELGEKELKGISTPVTLYEILPLSLSDRASYFDDSSYQSTSLSPFSPQSQMTEDGSVKEDIWQVNYEEIQFTTKELGAGSFGVVYLANYKGQEIAVKKFMKQKMTERQYFAILAEIMILREVHHETILGFHGACIKQPNICLLLEYAPFGSLHSVLNDTRIPLSQKQQQRIVFQIAEGMTFLHDRKPMIIHRDLKSANILVLSLDPIKVKIGDFGLARVKAGNQTMTKCGTRAWLAPEVMKGGRYDEKADVFSFAILAWEIFARERPYSDMDSLKLGFEVVNGLRPQMPKSIDQNMKDILVRCWDGEPSRRPSFSVILPELGSLL